MPAPKTESEKCHHSSRPFVLPATSSGNTYSTNRPKNIHERAARSSDSDSATRVRLESLPFDSTAEEPFLELGVDPSEIILLARIRYVSVNGPSQTRATGLGLRSQSGKLKRASTSNSTTTGATASSLPLRRFPTCYILEWTTTASLSCPFMARTQRETESSSRSPTTTCFTAYCVFVRLRRGTTAW